MFEINSKVYNEIVKLINNRVEGDYWDFKQEWHSDNERLLVDILCFANTIHNKDCYLIIGVADNGDIIGLTENSPSGPVSIKVPKLRKVTFEKCLGLVEALATVFPQAKYQRCIVHFYRNVFSVVPKSKGEHVAQMLKAIHAQEDRQSAQEKAMEVAQKLREMKLTAAAKKVEDSINETLTYMQFPAEHWQRIRSNNGIERVNREIRRRTRVVGTFPDGRSAVSEE